MLFLLGTRGVVGYDAIGANLNAVAAAHPSAQLATYTTGSGAIPATPAQLAAHPGILHICQDVGATDDTADYLDVENGAATFGDCPGWYVRTNRNYVAATRPGQRSPAIYASALNITSVVNSLISGGVKSGCGLIVANWNLTEAQAFADVINASGPFPIVGVQFSSFALDDENVFSEAWLTAVSGRVHRTVHTFDGRTSIGQVAASRKMIPISWLNLQYSMRPLDADGMMGSAVPPRGQRWWSE